LAGELAGELSKLHVRWRKTELAAADRELHPVPPMPHEYMAYYSNRYDVPFYAWCFEDRQQGNTKLYFFRPYEIFANALGGFPGKDQLIIGKGPHWKHLESPRRDPQEQGFPVFEIALGATGVIWEEEADLKEFCRCFRAALDGDATEGTPADDASDEDAPVGEEVTGAVTAK
jgi:hypothetical protein